MANLDFCTQLNKHFELLHNSNVKLNPKLYFSFY